ncbi:MAG TPA: hypothetical protein VH144_01590 [Candidatus Saccharimonadales bacterium]|jgi:hypothetical protein|nr:hypothetical protein [Candidatus Saccharimonadales bacterium]
MSDTSLGNIVQTMREQAARGAFSEAVEVGIAYLQSLTPEPPNMQFWRTLHAAYLECGQEVEAGHCRLNAGLAPRDLAYLEIDLANYALRSNQYLRVRGSLELARRQAGTAVATDLELSGNLDELEANLRDKLFGAMQEAALNRNDQLARQLATEILRDEEEDPKRRALAKLIKTADNPRSVLHVRDWGHFS